MLAPVSVKLVSESLGAKPVLFYFVLVCRSFRSAPGRIRTSDSRFRKPNRSVYRGSPALEIRFSKPFYVRLCSPGLTGLTVKLL
jgi:hypothetical protein